MELSNSMCKYHSFDVLMARVSACEDLLNLREVHVSECEGETLKAAILIIPLHLYKTKVKNRMEK